MASSRTLYPWEMPEDNLLMARPMSYGRMLAYAVTADALTADALPKTSFALCTSMLALMHPSEL